MRNVTVVSCCLLASLLGAASAGALEYAGYLSVNDDDYGYWEGRPMVFVDGDRLPLDEQHGATSEYVFALSHDLAQGLVRQFIPRAESERQGNMLGAVAEEATGVARGRKESEPPRGDGTWVPLSEFYAFGFGQYEGSDPTLHVYCDDGPEVWAWLSGPHPPSASPDDAADRVIRDELDMARLKLRCDRPIEPSP